MSKVATTLPIFYQNKIYLEVFSSAQNTKKNNNNNKNRTKNKQNVWGNQPITGTPSKNYLRLLIRPFAKFCTHYLYYLAIIIIFLNRSIQN